MIIVFIFQQARWTFPYHHQLDSKVQHGTKFPSSTLFHSYHGSLFFVPHTSNSCDHDPNHYWHTAPSPPCCFLWAPTTFRSGLGRKCDPEGCWSTEVLLFLRCRPCLTYTSFVDVCCFKLPAEVVLKCTDRVGLLFFNWGGLNWNELRVKQKCRKPT